MWLAFICIVAYSFIREGESKQSKFVYGGRRFGHKARCLSFAGFICRTIEAVPRSPRGRSEKGFQHLLLFKHEKKKYKSHEIPIFVEGYKRTTNIAWRRTEHEIFLCLNLPFSNTLVSGCYDPTRRRNLKKDKRKSWINIFSQKVFLITSIKMWFFRGEMLLLRKTAKASRRSRT